MADAPVPALRHLTPGERDETAAAAAVEAPAPRPHRRWSLAAAAFLLPALLILGALVVYPIVYTVVSSFIYKGSVGVTNYRHMFTDPGTLTSIRNTAIWVLVVPAVVTAVGLVFAVLIERIRWSTAFKVAVFMPMAISFLSAGVIWRLVYDQSPDKGLLNAGARAVSDVVSPPGPYPGAHFSDSTVMTAAGKSFVSRNPVAPGDTVLLGMNQIPPQAVPSNAKLASKPTPEPGAITGTVWLDFTLGGGGRTGVIDPKEKGLPGATVQAISNGSVVASAVTDDTGAFALRGLSGGQYRVAIGEATFRPAFGGIAWLGPALVTPAIMVAYVWIWAGFAMVIVGAGLAAIPREVLEAARVDGGTEWAVFRRVTVPLLAPVIAVVFVTLLINVLKVFDLVFVLPLSSTQSNASVIALAQWLAGFGGKQDQGLASALAVFLFLLVIPAMAFNIRRFRREA
jgi:alpha-glucoside transport system permease protein